MQEILKLSDSYIAKTADPMLELKVKMLNINLPVGHRILQECLPLYEYAWFIEQVRAYIESGMTRDKAVTLSVQDSIREGIFKDFVRKHGSEVENMLYTQFNLDDALKVRYEEGVEDGIERGQLRYLIHQVCGKLQRGDVPEKIAADLLEDEARIAEICELYEACGRREDAVCEQLEKQKDRE